MSGAAAAVRVQDELADDWSLIMDEDKPAPRHRDKASHPKKRKPILNFMETAKSKIYNMYKSYPREVATFSLQPVWLLGKRYDLEAQCRQRIAETHMRQAQAKPRVTSPALTFEPPKPSSWDDTSGFLSPPLSPERQEDSSDGSDCVPELRLPQEEAGQGSGGEQEAESKAGGKRLSARVVTEAVPDGDDTAEEETVGARIPVAAKEARTMSRNRSQPIPTLSPKAASMGSVTRHRRQRSHEEQFRRFYESATVPLNAVLTVASPELRPFMRDFVSLSWLTYRSHFPPLKFSDVTSDMGWGCMVRSGQMMLARTLVSLVLGRDWRLSKRTDSVHTTLLGWFLDRPGAAHPYSIHNIMQVAACLNLMPGEWFGPSTISRVLKALVRTHSPNSITMYVARQHVVYVDAVEALCKTKPRTMFSPKLPRKDKDKGAATSDGSVRCKVPSGDALGLKDKERREDEAKQCIKPDDYFRPVLIVVPVRLGLRTVNKEYLRYIKDFLTFPQSVGIIGGKPNSSLYFVGWQGDHLIYLDPHRVHAAASMDPQETFAPETIHCKTPYKIPAEDIDPSMAMGFFCRNRDEFSDLCERVKAHMQGDSMMTVFAVEENTPDDESDEEDRDKADAEIAQVAADLLLL
mmetsp:Transcript_3340/g.11735  ORF Transcript_3340/g.11735 Transcript_3340/m.11735 type:complete len:633 (+) Transcript_3340:88-1986(+)